jgi:hypothetical protein
MTERERRVQGLDIQPLTDVARASYAGQWTRIQEQFVDAPADAVSGAKVLVAAVMTERGYPAGQQDQDQVAAEDLRQATVHYRALFGDLPGEAAGQGPEPAVAAASTSQQSTGSDSEEIAK